MELAPQICDCIFLQRNAGMNALLGAVVHQPILANIEVAPASAAAPLIRTAKRDVVLKGVNAREAAFLEILHLVIHTPFFVVQRLYLPGAVVNDSDRRTEAQLQRALANGQSILRMAYAAANY